eukprot:TRINITY_DN5795_c0_g3_i1.p2 TRINITY_DN5795_c0_g3~~TRINITY_DN5795_c0_g3_i1.p2  ORF type:complete len:114 (+),score=19.91 TRINITY_DN5795_c0_g3_i1:73-414(+)
MGICGGKGRARPEVAQDTRAPVQARKPESPASETERVQPAAPAAGPAAPHGAPEAADAAQQYPNSLYVPPQPRDESAVAAASTGPEAPGYPGCLWVRPEPSQDILAVYSRARG